VRYRSKLLRVAGNPREKTFSQTFIGQQCFRLTAGLGYRDHNVVIAGRAGAASSDNASERRSALKWRADFAISCAVQML
jgi:hypothetical protein